MYTRYIALTLVAACALTSPASANEDRALASVAAAESFTYEWLPTETGVVLTRDGVRVILRPGRIFYEVNNATPIADRAPIFNGEDLLISPALAARLHDIAQSAVSAHLSEPEGAKAPAAARRVPEKPRPITIATQRIPGRTALALSGTGTPNTTLAITLTGNISKDLPIVLIRRATALVNTNGTYSIEMSYGPDAHNGTTLTVTVAAAAGADRAVAHVVLDSVLTGSTSSALDDWPKN